MLPRSQRLVTRQFDQVLKKGRAIHSSLFFIQVLPEQEKTRFAAVVPKKVAKSAVDRNHLRRQMYEAIAKIHTNAKKGLYVIVYAKPASFKAKYSDIETHIKNIFVKAAIVT